jgi:parallel beta-helix repeat protein
MRSALSQTFCLLLLICLVSLALSVAKVRCGSSTITVPDNYPTIQEAINGAHDGDSVFVRSGVYYEHLVVNKSISLVGEDSRNTVIDGNRSDKYIVSLLASGVTLRNFMVANSDSIAVEINRSSNDVIMGNRLFHEGVGVWLEQSENSLIQNNVIFDTSFAVLLDTGCNNTIVTSNRISEATFGTILTNSNNNTISRNIMRNCNMYVVYLAGNGILSRHNRILENEFWTRPDAYFTTRLEVSGAPNTAIYGNSFINIRMGDLDTGIITWDNGSAGNYWNDYNGTDTDNDGIGDTPYAIHPYVEIQPYGEDKKPLMSPNFLLPGDVSLDGSVDMFDALQGASAFGSKRGDPNWNAFADFNKDNVIDIFDLLIVARNFGRTFPSI